MGKKEGVISDVDFIKEVESLKIKQKLLIESLKRKNQTEENKLFLEINSKLDFLVKIFTESSKAEGTEDNETDSPEETLNSVAEKIESFKNEVLEKIDHLELKISDISVSKPSMPVRLADEKLNENSSNNGQKISPEDGKKEDLPPPPDFESKIEGVQEDSAKDSESQKKKKWF